MFLKVLRSKLTVRNYKEFTNSRPVQEIGIEFLREDLEPIVFKDVSYEDYYSGTLIVYEGSKTHVFYEDNLTGVYYDSHYENFTDYTCTVDARKGLDIEVDLEDVLGGIV